MGIDRDVINLKAARKARERAEARAEADANAAKFGRSKAERVLQATLTERTRRKLDQLKFEDE